MDNGSILELVGYLVNDQLARYLEVCSTALLYYDFCLTFSDEIEYVWRRQWSFITVLFIFTRYFAVLGTVFILLFDYLPGLSLINCQIPWHFTAWSYIIGLTAAEAIFMRRTYALWYSDAKLPLYRWIRVLCIITLVLSLAVSGYVSERVIMSVQFSRFDLPGSVVQGCVSLHEDNVLWIGYAILLVTETVVLFFTIPKVYGNRNDLGKRSLSYVIYRDGFLFYVYILIISIINIIGLVALEGGLAVSITRIHRDLHSIFSVRLLLNMRKASATNRRGNGETVILPTIVFAGVGDDESGKDLKL